MAYNGNMTRINQTVLMSGADYFAVEELNPYSHKTDQPNVEKAKEEFQNIKIALETAGVQVIKIDAPKSCQDAIYTANWGLSRGDKVILSSLPTKRDIEQPHAKQALLELGKELIEAPYLFSGQGDALPCGNLLFAGQGYRTDPRMHEFIARTLNYEVISLQTIPFTDVGGKSVINTVTGLADSLFYDIDLALSILRTDLIAWCPEAFTAESQAKLRALESVEKIEIDYHEAIEGFACNLVSTGDTVIMSNRAPKLKAAVEAKGLKTITPAITELAKGGGYIRCTTLTLDNL